MTSSPDCCGGRPCEIKATRRVHLIQLRGFGEPAGRNASGPVLQPFVDELAADYVGLPSVRVVPITGSYHFAFLKR